jgi:hypothetical protein
MEPVRRPTTNHLSKLSAAIVGYRVAMHGNRAFAGTLLAAYTVSVGVSNRLYMCQYFYRCALLR